MKVKVDLMNPAGRTAMCAGAEPEREQDACPEDPDGVHFVGCGCDYASPDDPEPEREGEADTATATA